MLSDLDNLIESKSIIKGSQELRSFLISVHGLRSALFAMDRPDLSAAAARLELLCREENTNMVYAEAPAFLEELRTYIAQVAALDAEHKDGKVYICESEEDRLFLREKLLIIQNACEDYDDHAIEKALEQLHAKKRGKTAEDMLALISDQLLRGDFGKISETIQAFVGE